MGRTTTERAIKIHFEWRKVFKLAYQLRWQRDAHVEFQENSPILRGVEYTGYPRVRQNCYANGTDR